MTVQEERALVLQEVLDVLESLGLQHWAALDLAQLCRVRGTVVELPETLRLHVLRDE